MESTTDTPSDAIALKMPLYRFIPLALVVCIGIILSALAFRITWNYEQKYLKEYFQKSAYNRVMALKNEISNNINAIEWAKAFCTTSPQITQERFQLFIQNYLEKQRSIQVLEWIPLIFHSKGTINGKNIIEDGVTNFQITGKLSPKAVASGPNDYSSVYFANPDKEGPVVLDCNVTSTLVQLKAPQLLSDTEQLLAASRVTLIQEDQNQFEFLVYAPIYQSSYPSNPAKIHGKTLIGFVLGVYRIGNILEVAMKNFKPIGINVYIFDLPDSQKELFLASYIPNTSPKQDLPVTLKEVKEKKALFYTAQFNVGERKWLVLCTADDFFACNKIALVPLLILGGGISITFFLAIYILLLIRYNDKIKRYVNKLTVYQSRLKLLSTKLLLVEEQERKSIAIGLHDSVGYNLVDIETELKKLKKTTSNPEITAKLENLEVMVNWVVQKTRLLTFKLSNPTLRKLGFVAAVKQWLEEQIKGKYGIKCKLITNNSIIQLDKNVSIILYKIVQELTMNVVKHANANTLKVQIKQTNGQIQIAIKDDGVGFSADSFSDIPQAKRYNLGLFAAKERLEFIGGSLNLKSAPGRGTCAKVTSPISNTELNIDYLEG